MQTATIAEIKLVGRLGAPCRYCGYRCAGKGCLCHEGGESPAFCPQCGIPRDLPLNKE